MLFEDNTVIKNYRIWRKTVPEDNMLIAKMFPLAKMLPHSKIVALEDDVTLEDNVVLEGNIALEDDVVLGKDIVHREDVALNDVVTSGCDVAMAGGSNLECGS
jgi:hypothetical protein